MSPAHHKLFLSVSTLLVLAAVVWGFVIVGSPDARRLERLDETRLDDLQRIQREIQDLVKDDEVPATLKRALPATLDAVLALARRRRLSLADPETGERYGYRVLDERRYELCATFARAREADFGVFWNHPAGRHCFTVDVLDPP